MFSNSLFRNLSCIFCAMLFVAIYIRFLCSFNGTDTSTIATSQKYFNTDKLRRIIADRMELLQEMAAVTMHGQNTSTKCSKQKYLSVAPAIGRTGNMFIQISHGLWFAKASGRTFIYPDYADKLLEPFEKSLLHELFCIGTNLGEAARRPWNVHGINRIQKMQQKASQQVKNATNIFTMNSTLEFNRLIGNATIDTAIVPYSSTRTRGSALRGLNIDDHSRNVSTVEATDGSQNKSDDRYFDGHIGKPGPFSSNSPRRLHDDIDQLESTANGGLGTGIVQRGHVRRPVKKDFEMNRELDWLVLSARVRKLVLSIQSMIDL